MPQLSLYVHVPFCLRKCGYCSFVSFPDRDETRQKYTDALTREITLSRQDGFTVSTIYFGGGTPSLMSERQINAILERIHQLYTVSEDAEITLEANPGTVDGKYLQSVRKLGFNRLSLGVQSLSEKDLVFLGRCHSAKDSLRAIHEARLAGFNNLSLDFIYGLPNRTTSVWRGMLDEIIGLSADHLSLYGLTLDPDTPLGRAVASGRTPAPDPDQAAEEYEITSRKLAEAGYRHYEISNWARPGFESRHNTVYWKRGEYLGLGVAAHSFINGSRISNTVSLDGYLETLSKGELPRDEIEAINPELALSETIFLGLRLEDGISMDDIGRQFSIDLPGRYVREIAELSALGLVEVSGGNLKLTPRGRLLGNEVFLRFLPS
ncbi:oxygen-independent coproporphyrinogen-3 oxidase [Dehalogenimonas formicexedens]|uniref:Heme chaperone HemW n=1 Tax=Dehalogenimonas formicexedens TaxID=1839801 RepID=A0A1P8F6B8_9CHLR|nr:radical SAM family heme chaperone HemW [Dehalogenimonas formicexedens]APV44026.1 oxygen-independent coproporphyrinogen-3 oxidase [Dehalogenimonas formicexedens]